MPATNPRVINVGEDCWIEARNIRSSRTGTLIDVTGFPVHAIARAIYLPITNSVDHSRSPVIAEWSTDPVGAQGDIRTGTDTETSDPHCVEIHITPSQTVDWRCTMVLIQAELTDPVTGYVGRIVDGMYRVNHEVVR